MNKTSEEQVREIIIKRLKKEKIRKRKRRLIILIITLFIVLFFAIGLFMNRHVLDPPKLDRGIIYIDPGHGGSDSGAQTKNRNEKDDTLKLALALKRELNKKNFTVYMSREEDKDVPREKIAKRANRTKADLMVSIHRNKADDKTAQGVEIYISKRNNKKSRYLAKQLMNNLHEQGFRKRKIRAGTLVSKTQDYYELLTTKMPACLIEVGFMSNKRDNKLFDKGLKDNAKAMAKGIEKAYNHLYEDDKKYEMNE